MKRNQDELPKVDFILEGVEPVAGAATLIATRLSSQPPPARWIGAWLDLSGVDLVTSMRLTSKERKEQERHRRERDEAHDQFEKFWMEPSPVAARVLDQMKERGYVVPGRHAEFFLSAEVFERSRNPANFHPELRAMFEKYMRGFVNGLAIAFSRWGYDVEREDELDALFAVAVADLDEGRFEDGACLVSILAPVYASEVRGVHVLPTLERVLAHKAEPALDVRVRAGLRMSLALIAEALANYEVARERMLEALRFAESVPDEHNRIAGMLRILGRIEGRLGRMDEMHATMGRAVERLEDGLPLTGRLLSGTLEEYFDVMEKDDPEARVVTMAYALEVAPKETEEDDLRCLRLLMKLSRCQAEAGFRDDALRNAKLALRIAKEILLPEDEERSEIVDWLVELKLGRRLR